MNKAVAMNFGQQLVAAGTFEVEFVHSDRPLGFFRLFHYSNVLKGESKAETSRRCVTDL